MSAVGKVIVVGGAIILVPMAYNALTTYLAADKIDFKPSGISKFEIDKGYIYFIVKYLINNPENKQIDVSNLLVQASFDNGPVIATVSQPNKITIPAMSSMNGSFPVKSGSLIWLGVDLLPTLIKWFETKSIQAPKAVRLRGSVTANGFKVPYDTKLNLPAI